MTKRNRRVRRLCSWRYWGTRGVVGLSMSAAAVIFLSAAAPATVMARSDDDHGIDRSKRVHREEWYDPADRDDARENDVSIEDVDLDDYAIFAEQWMSTSGGP